jgi:4'-phosphopantetheinyl transferase
MSLSAAHSDRAVLVAACSHALVGIDLEALALAKGWSGADREAFDQVALSDHERESLAVLSTECADGARLRAWVRKEAVLKATGLGLAVPPRGLEFSDAAPDAGAAGAVLRSWPAELDPFCSGPVAVVDFAPRAPGYVAAVAVLGASRCAIVPEAVSDPIPLASNPIPLPLEAL